MHGEPNGAAVRVGGKTVGDNDDDGADDPTFMT
jgi:hypothetical protein